jgi:drug/metabolite transporter (DMT)-like permease
MNFFSNLYSLSPHQDHLAGQALKFWGRSQGDVQDEWNAAMAWMLKSGDSSSDRSDHAPGTHHLDAYPVPSNPSGIFHPIIILLLAIIFWSSAFVGIRYGVQSYSPEGLALLRYLIASLCMGLVYFFTRKKYPKRRWKEIWPALLLGIFGFSLYNILLNYGERQVSASIASFINGLAPAMVAVMAIWVYGERLNGMAKLGMLISLLGTALILCGELHSPLKLWSVLITFLAIACGAVYTLMQKKMVIKMSAIEFTSYAIWGGTAAMLIFMPKLYVDLQHAQWGVTLMVIYMGIFPGALAYLLASYSYSKMSIAKASCYSYLIPLFSTLFAFLFLGEMPAIFSLVGGIIAFVGAIVVQRA